MILHGAQLPVRAGFPQAPGRTAIGSVLDVLQANLSLQVVRGGDVLPWIGPALRGVVARRLKAETCRSCVLPRHRYDCAYGALYEPALAPGETGDRGRRELPRPVVLAPQFPLPERVRADERLKLVVTLIGRRNMRFVGPLLGAVSRAVAGEGLGPDQVRFRLLHDSRPAPTSLSSFDFADVSAERIAYWPRVTISFDSPVFLCKKPDDLDVQWQPNAAFGTLWRASARTISAFFHREGTPLQVNYASWCDLAATVTDADTTGFSAFEQRRYSSRSGERYAMVGVQGSVTFRAVPQALVPWVVWGGLLHVGEHRVAGAGGWSVTLN